MRPAAFRRSYTPEDVLVIARHMWEIHQAQVTPDLPAVSWEDLSAQRRWALIDDATSAIERIEQRSARWYAERAGA